MELERSERLAELETVYEGREAKVYYVAWVLCECFMRVCDSVFVCVVGGLRVAYKTNMHTLTYTHERPKQSEQQKAAEDTVPPHTLAHP